MTDGRAVSTTLGYALNLGVATLLVTGLLIAGGDFVENQREQAARTELRVVGQQAASGVEAADRLVQASRAPNTVEVERVLPQEITARSYTVRLTGGADPHVDVEMEDPDIDVRIALANQTAVANSSASGGTIVVVYDAGSDTLEVRDA